MLRMRNNNKLEQQSMVHHRIYPLFNFELYLVVKVRPKMSQYLPHHMTYAPAKFEVATSNGLGGYAITRTHII